MLSDQFLSSWEELVSFDRLRQYRLDRVTSAVRDAGLDVLISFKSDSIRYISSLRPLIWEAGYQTRNIAIVDTRGNVCLYVASGDYQRVVENDPWLKTVKPLASMEDAGISSKVINDQLLPQLKEMGLAGARAFRRFATSNPVRAGDSVIVNLSAMNDGYCAEATRTFLAGRAPAATRALRATLEESYNSLVRKLVPSARLRDIFAAYSNAVGTKA